MIIFKTLSLYCSCISFFLRVLFTNKNITVYSSPAYCRRYRRLCVCHESWEFNDDDYADGVFSVSTVCCLWWSRFPPYVLVCVVKMSIDRQTGSVTLCEDFLSLWDRPKIAGGIYTGRQSDKSRTVFDLLDIVTSCKARILNIVHAP